MAQSGSAPGLGPGGPRFESLYSDQFFKKENSMTCRGYDPKAVKIGKLVKIAGSSILDPHKRGDFFRSYTKVAQENLRSGGRKEK